MRKDFLHALCFKLHAFSERGMALVLTLMILTLITAMVVEFTYGVYMTTSALHNWRDLQKLSFVAKSGISLALKTISEIPRDELRRFPESVVTPVENILEGFTGSVTVSVKDENGKFNLNSLRNPASQTVFRRLIKNLGLDENIAGRIIDWIDAGSTPEPGLYDSEEGAKNGFLDCVDELLLIKGIDRLSYEALFPYVTVYGYSGASDSRVNINTAPIPVIMSLGISKEHAEGIVNYRKQQPFTVPGDLGKVGIDHTPIVDLFTNGPPRNFYITSVAEENKIKRVIEAVVSAEGLTTLIRYWREM